MNKQTKRKKERPWDKAGENLEPCKTGNLYFKVVTRHAIAEWPIYSPSGSSQGWDLASSFHPLPPQGCSAPEQSTPAPADEPQPHLFWIQAGMESVTSTFLGCIPLESNVIHCAQETVYCSNWQMISNLWSGSLVFVCLHYGMANPSSHIHKLFCEATILLQCINITVGNLEIHVTLSLSSPPKGSGFLLRRSRRTRSHMTQHQHVVIQGRYGVHSV